MTDIERYAEKLKERMKAGEIVIPENAFFLLTETDDGVEVEFASDCDPALDYKFDLAVEGMGS